jgi:hypothetical protein
VTEYFEQEKEQLVNYLRKVKKKFSKKYMIYGVG